VLALLSFLVVLRRRAYFSKETEIPKSKQAGQVHECLSYNAFLNLQICCFKLLQFRWQLALTLAQEIWPLSEFVYIYLYYLYLHKSSDMCTITYTQRCEGLNVHIHTYTYTHLSMYACVCIDAYIHEYTNINSLISFSGCNP